MIERATFRCALCGGEVERKVPWPVLLMFCPRTERWTLMRRVRVRSWVTTTRRGKGYDCPRR